MAKYNVKSTTYVKTPTGRLNRYGRPEYETTNIRERVYKDANFSEIKKKTYEKSKKDKNVYVRYSKPTYSIYSHPKRLVNVTKKFADGHKEVTYYKPVRGK